MNRHDEIQALARDIASNVHAEEGPRNAMADGLIKLIGRMLNAQGKYLAVYGEGEMNEVSDWKFEKDPEDTPESEAERFAEFEHEQREDAAKYHGIYQAGERMQRSSVEIVESCTNPRVDLERWNDSPSGGWTHVDRRPAMFRNTDQRGALIIPPEVIRGSLDTPPQPLHCNCCGGKCRNDDPAFGPERCCYPLGDVCPDHC